MASNKKSEIHFLTTASGLAILCVLLIHSHQRYLSFLFGKEVPIWSELPLFDNVYEHLVIFAVGLFVLVSGFKFELTRNIRSLEHYLVFVKQRADRLIRPFFWITTIFAVGNVALQVLNLAQKKEIVSFFSFIDIYIQRLLGIMPHPNHLWYIPMLVFVSFLYPIIRSMVPNHKIRLFLFVATEIILGVFQFTIYPFYWFRFLIVYEVGTMFCRDYKDRNSEVFYSSKRYIFFALFIALFFARKFNGEIAIDYWLVQLYWVIGPITYFYFSYYLCKSYPNKMFLWLGKYSWPIYLFHEPYLVVASYGIAKKMHFGESVFAIVISTVIPIWLSVLFYKKIKNRKLGKFIL